MPRRGRKNGKYSYAHKNADHTGGGLGVAKLEKELRHQWASVQGRRLKADHMAKSVDSGAGNGKDGEG